MSIKKATSFEQSVKNSEANESLLNPSPDDKHYLPDVDNKGEDTRLITSNFTEKNARSVKKEPDWKPAINVSYETLALTATSKNDKVRPAGFRSSGKHR